MPIQAAAVGSRDLLRVQDASAVKLLTPEQVAKMQSREWRGSAASSA
jgi:hypothetical protein